MILELLDMVLEISERSEQFNGLKHYWLEGRLLSGRLLIQPGGWLYLAEEQVAAKFRVTNDDGCLKSEGPYRMLDEEVRF